MGIASESRGLTGAHGQQITVFKHPLSF